MSDKVYIIGHKSPDLDSVAAAISYAYLKNNLEETDKYIPAVAGELNKETKYVLEKFSIKKPELLSNSEGKNIILVDHNEFFQAVTGAQNAKIIEVLDHHKVNFKYSEPILFNIKPWGASCSVIADMYFNMDMEPGKDLAGLMLSAVLVDTVITKSPTCTGIDKIIIEKLAEIAEIEEWKEYGMEIFKVRSSVNDLPAADIVKSDFKDFALKAGKIGIGQVETVDISELEPREDELIAELDKLRSFEGYHSTILFITDIINEGSKFLVSSSKPEMIEKAFGVALNNNRVYIEGIISRKKQVAPKIIEEFDK